MVPKKKEFHQTIFPTNIINNPNIKKIIILMIKPIKTIFTIKKLINLLKENKKK